MHAKSLQSCLTPCDPVDHSPPGSSMGSRQEYENELLFSSPGDLPDLGIEPTSPVSPALQVDSLPENHQRTTGEAPLMSLLTL